MSITANFAKLKGRDIALQIIKNVNETIAKALDEGLIERESIVGYPAELHDTENLYMCELCKRWYIE